MTKEQLSKVVDTFFNVGDYEEAEVKKFEKVHSFMAIGFFVGAIILAIILINIICPSGLELDHIPSHKL